MAALTSTTGAEPSHTRPVLSAAGLDPSLHPENITEMNKLPSFQVGNRARLGVPHSSVLSHLLIRRSRKFALSQPSWLPVVQDSSPSSAARSA